MDFVDEKDGAPAIHFQARDGGGQDAAQVGDGRLDAVEPLEVARGAARDHLGQRRFSHARRPEKNQRGEPVGLDQTAQRLARRKQVALADKLFQRAGTEPRGQRGVG